MTQLHIRQVPCLKDNYGVLIHDPEGGVTASVDAPDATVLLSELETTGWHLTHILATHHHADHTGGIPVLRAKTGCRVIGPRDEAQRIPGLDLQVAEPDEIAFGRFSIRVMSTPGHTLGHVSYWIPDAKVAFVGDTLFAMGCGRILEGTAEMMWHSLSKIAQLPADTQVYCGHEYTLANARFGLAIEPENTALRQRAHDVEAMRAAGKPTLPTRMGLELETNVFLRPMVYAIRERLGLKSAPDWRVFAEMRERKNKF